MSALPVSDYSGSGVAALVGATDGLGNGLVADGTGAGGSSTDFVGEGSGKLDGFPLFEFPFALLAFWFPLRSIGLSLSVGEAETFAFWFAVAL